MEWIVIGSCLIVIVLLHGWMIWRFRKQQIKALDEATLVIFNEGGKRFLNFTCEPLLNTSIIEEIPNTAQLDTVSLKEVIRTALIQNPSLSDDEIIRGMGGYTSTEDYHAKDTACSEVRNEMTVWNFSDDIECLNNLAYQRNPYAMNTISELNLWNARPDKALAGCLNAYFNGATEAALHTLGLIVAQGYLKKISPEMSLEIFKCAAGYGNPPALRNVGAYFLKGRDTEMNKEFGRRLLTRASNMGFPNIEEEEK